MPNICWILDLKDELLNPQAYSTNSMTELNSLMSSAFQNETVQDNIDETSCGKIKKRLKNKSEVLNIKQLHTIYYRSIRFTLYIYQFQ